MPVRIWIKKVGADWDFDGTRQKAKDIWNSYLSRISDRYPDELRIFIPASNMH